MHTQAQSTEQSRGRPAGPGAASPSLDAGSALRLLSEQGAIPLDQLARFLDYPLAQIVSTVQELEKEALIEHRRFLIAEGPWFWPSRRGVRLVETGFHYAVPDVAMLAHRRAVNEVRLHLAERAPQGRWICERAVLRRRGPDDHLPDALFEIAGERHAIEVELSHKTDREIRQILTKHSDRYDAVIYFCGPETYRMMKRLGSEGHWPKLVVRRLPRGEE